MAGVAGDAERHDGVESGPKRSAVLEWMVRVVGGATGVAMGRPTGDSYAPS